MLLSKVEDMKAKNEEQERETVDEVRQQLIPNYYYYYYTVGFVIETKTCLK